MGVSVVYYSMKEKKTFRFTIASGWSGTIKAYGILWAVTQLKNRGHDVKKIEELSQYQASHI